MLSCEKNIVGIYVSCDEYNTTYFIIIRNVMLQAFVHVSTAYANCHLDTIDETLYAAPMEHERLRRIVENVDDDDLLDTMLPK